MALTEINCRTAKAKDKDYKLSDGGGMHLLVKKAGTKYWRMKYRYAGKEKLLSLGVYPDLSLKEARIKRDEAKKQLTGGIDPSQAKQEAKQMQILKAGNSFEMVAREWHDNKKDSWTAKHAQQVLVRMEKDLFPAFGNMPIADITAQHLLACLRKIEKRGAIDIAHRALQMSGQVFRYGIVTGRAERDISADLKGALKPKKVKHNAYLKADDLPELFDKLENYDGDPQTIRAMKFMILTMTRTIEVRGARWEEIDFNKGVWNIPAERMKMRRPHFVPLSKQALEILEAQKLESHNREHVFPNSQNPRKCMSENTILYALYRMGYHSRATGHGFRSTASTILNEHDFKSDIIERQLAHSETNKVRAAYNHAEYKEERTTMMQWYADYLDELKGA